MRDGDEQSKSSRGGDETGRTDAGREGVKAEGTEKKTLGGERNCPKGRRRNRRLEET